MSASGNLMPVLAATLGADPAKASLSDARVDDIAQDAAGFARCGASASPTGRSPMAPRAARARIDHGDLTALLFAQGITRKDFMEG